MFEEKIEFESNGAFYNPKMHFCRSFFSLAVGTIDKKITLTDGFCASGIRGIRYFCENNNIAGANFIDASSDAIALCKKNLEKNNLNAQLIESDFNKGIREIESDLIEIDPFGTPVPYLFDAVRSLRNKKEAYLSITATDVAVLCGPHKDACIKNYHSKSLNNEFTHENGIRILLKRICETLLEFNFGIEPLVSLSDQHYLKVFLKINKGDIFARKSISNLGFTFFCHKCSNRISGSEMQANCAICNSKMLYSGQLWTGALHSKGTIKKMKAINKKRNYLHKEKISKILDFIEGEIGFPPYYFDLHQLSRLKKKKFIPKIDDAIKKLEGNGFLAKRTHFSQNSIKTNAKIKEIEESIYF